METRNYTYDADILSDLHKDAYGFRPRSEEFWAAWDSADNDGKQRIWDNLLDALNDAIIVEKDAQEEAIADLEHRIRFMMNTVAGCDRADAIRYLHDAYQTHGDVEYLEFNLGVPYGYLSGRKAGELETVTESQCSAEWLTFWRKVL